MKEKSWAEPSTEEQDQAGSSALRKAVQLILPVMNEYVKANDSNDAKKLALAHVKLMESILQAAVEIDKVQETSVKSYKTRCLGFQFFDRFTVLASAFLACLTNYDENDPKQFLGNWSYHSMMGEMLLIFCRIFFVMKSIKEIEYGFTEQDTEDHLLDRKNTKELLRIIKRDK